jgi:hypothetical protein
VALIHATYLMARNNIAVPELPAYAYLGIQSQYLESSVVFDNTFPSRLVPSYSLIPLDSEGGDLVNQYSGRWGYLERNDPGGTSNGPAGPPSRAALKGSDEPVVLLSEPCRLHNLSRKTSQLEELCIPGCISQVSHPDEACTP